MDRIALPEGAAPAPTPLPHFPDRLHAFIWRNWSLVPLERMAQVVGASPEAVRRLGRSMGLVGPPPVPADQFRRTSLTIIRRNWHLLPYEQLLELLEWTPERMAYTLQEDDFLYIKLGRLKPRCPPVRWQAPDAAARRRAAEIARIVRETLGNRVGLHDDPPLGFLPRLTAPVAKPAPAPLSRFSPRYCYAYFALYGDPLLDEGADLLPDGYLARMAEAGVDGIWIQGVLSHLAPFPWDLKESAGYEKRLAHLHALTERAARRGVRIWLYLNEPRSLPLAFFQTRPELKGVAAGEYAALCTSVPAVRQWMEEAVATLCRATPDLAGLFTITASENLTSCWSHGHGGDCPRCARRTFADVIAEVNGTIQAGIRRAGSRARLLAWDWGWPDDQAEATIARLPAEAALMSVSEWSLPIERGGVKSEVGEYCLSAVGPGPRATRHWEWARRRGLKTIAKIQAGLTWELGAVPYIPAVENAARHAANLRGARVDGLMLGWTLGGYPSPNLEVTAVVANPDAEISPDEAMLRVARRRFGARAASEIVEIWKAMSAAFSEFPYHIGVGYNSPVHFGPSNLLYEAPTGYAATMVGLPYDDLDRWRAIYPPAVFCTQLEKAAAGFERGAQRLRNLAARAAPARRRALADEANVAEACFLHFASVANQARFVLRRRDLADSAARRELAALLDAEIDLARRLYALQRRDSRIGFEASNQYYYVPLDLAEKILNCRDLRQRWLGEG